MNLNDDKQLEKYNKTFDDYFERSLQIFNMNGEFLSSLPLDDSTEFIGAYPGANDEILIVCSKMNIADCSAKPVLFVISKTGEKLRDINVTVDGDLVGLSIHALENGNYILSGYGCIYLVNAEGKQIAKVEDPNFTGIVLCSGGKWYDFTDEALVDKVFGDTAKLMTFDNFPIKGYCRMQPDISIRVSGNTPLDLYGNNQTILRVSFKGHDGHAVQSDCEWELAEGGSDLFDIERDPADPFRVRVTAKAIGCANLFVTVKGAGTTVVPLSVQKLELFSLAIIDDEIIYNGNALKPKVEVYDIADNVISPAHYTLKYTNNTKCGTAKVTATAKTDDTEYTGSHEMEFLISPAKAVIKSLADGKNSLTITVKDQKASGVKGYEVSYRIKGSSAWKTKNFKATSNKLVLKNLKKGKIYQVRVRATEGYHEELDGHNFGEYSAVNTSSGIGIAPSKPRIRSLKARKGRLTVKLKGETPAGVKSYKVQYRIKGTKKWTTKTFKASGTKLVIRKLTKGKKYQVRIRAVKHSGLVSKYSKTKTGKKIK